MRLSIITSALVAALVGFAGTLAIVVAAAQAIGADVGETSSWIAAICLAVAGSTLWLSLRHRQPIITAWSTPGAALIAATGGQIGFEAAVGAFLLVALLIGLTAAIRPLGELIARIPGTLAAAMLAGVLVQFVMGAFAEIAVEPAFVLPLVALFFLFRIFSPSGAILAVLVAGVGAVFALGLNGPLPAEMGLSRLVWTTPAFDLPTLLGLGLPLYLVTMASQNLPGFVVLRASGYQPPARPILGVTALGSLLSAPFGGHTSNLAAVTAALCTGPDTHPDPAKRWMTGPFYAACYLVLAVFGASLVGLFAAMPPALIATVAGLPLLGPLTGALTSAFQREDQLTPAVVTFAVTASGLTLFGVGSPLWGLIAGLVVLALERVRARRQGQG